MFVLGRIILLVCLLVHVNGSDEDQIYRGIKPISEGMYLFYHYHIEQGGGFENVLTWTDHLTDIGLQLYPNLTDFADSIIMMIDHFKHHDNFDMNIRNGLTMIKLSSSALRYVIYNNNLIADIDNDMVREKFNISIMDKVYKVQNELYKFFDGPDMYHKNRLTQTCITTNGLKDVLTDLHIEIVNRDGNNHTFSQLMDGGVSLRYNNETSIASKL